MLKRRSKPRARKRRGADSPGLWKEKAWKAFSEWFRRSHADYYGVTECFTCGNKAHWTEHQTGHFIDGRSNSVLFNPEVCEIQCFRCNIRLRGNKDAYAPRMVVKHGLKKVEEMWNLKNKVVQFKIYDYIAIQHKYKQLNAIMDQEEKDEKKQT